jgi:hypothetical protein
VALDNLKQLAAIISRVCMVLEEILEDEVQCNNQNTLPLLFEHVWLRSLLKYITETLKDLWYFTFFKNPASNGEQISDNRFCIRAESELNAVYS